jgi:probable phosphoglycerate mutase
MKIILARHGETVEGQHYIILGQLPGTLSLKGIAYAKCLGAWLMKHILPQRIISSDLARAKDTTQYILDTFHHFHTEIPVVYSTLVRERDAGIMQGVQESTVDWDTYEQKKIPYRKHRGGESFMDVKKRAKSFLLTLKKDKTPCILVVTHSVFMAMVVACFYGQSIKESLSKQYHRHVVIIDTEKNEPEYYGIDENGC